MDNLLDKLKLKDKKIFLIILVSLLVFYLDFVFLIRAQLSGIGSVGKKITDLKKNLNTFKKDLITMQQAQIKEKTASAPQIQKIISEEQIPSLLDEISRIANKNNVKIMQIKPQMEKENKTAQIAKAAPLLTITIDLFSGYHTLGYFINELENAQVYIAVGEIKISPELNNYFQQKVTLGLKTHVKK
jgi:Tfp pilus assembly protein PilO